MKPTIVTGLLGDNPPEAHLYYGLDVLDALRLLPDESVNMVCTSPPYWGLRDYDVPPRVWGGNPDCEHDWEDELVLTDHGGGDSVSCTLCNAWRGCLGLEPTPEMFIEHLVEIFREVKRVLHPTGTLWLNLGDSYMSHSAQNYANLGGREGARVQREDGYGASIVFGKKAGVSGLKDKDLVGIPWRAALALQADGWWLRNDIIWHKCLGAGTRLYARTPKREGPFLLKDLARQDPGTVELWNGSKWTKVIRWERVRAEGLEFEFRSGEKVTCTPEHRWPTARGLLEAKAMVVGDVVQTTRTSPAESSSLKEKTDLVSEDLGWLLGVFLRDGDLSEYEDGFTLSSYGNPSRDQRIGRLVQRYGGTYHVRPQKDGGLDIHIRCGLLRFEIQGSLRQHQRNRRSLAPLCWNRGESYLRAVVEGYLEDRQLDSTYNRHRLYVLSKDLVHDLHALAAYLGAEVTLQKGHSMFRGEWAWRRTGHPNEKPRSEIVAIRKGKGRVFYDIEVADEPHLFSTASGLLTHNSNAMPSSVQDRFSCKYEHIFLFAKNARYFFDLEAVKVPHTYGTYQADGTFEPAQQWFEKGEGHRKMDQTEGQLGALAGSPRRAGRGLFSETGKNRGDIWKVATGGYKGAHFAVWPEKLVEPMIQAGSSEEGRCPSCKTPWWRGDDGWQPGCSCPDHEPERCVVLDTFSGSGTTGSVALRLERNYIGLDLNGGYRSLAVDRLRGRPSRAKKAVVEEPDLIGELFGGGE